MNTKIQSSLRGATLLLAASLAITFTAHAADTKEEVYSAPSDSPKAPHRDRAFFEKAAESGVKEVAVSQAVMGHLANPQVQAFANSMVADHTILNKEVIALAVSKGVAVSETKTAKLTEKWSEKDGNVDKKYLHEMIEDHEEAVKLFEKASKNDDADIAGFAQRTLPALQHHLQMAKDLKKSLN